MKNIISVVLATFNGEKYILEQLKSISRQKRIPDEVIISDDQSGDRTKKIVLEFIKENKLRNWKLIENNGKKGVTHNFLNALKCARGNIIFLCDQDDIWEIDKVETMENVFADTGISCVISKIKYIDALGTDIFGHTAYTCGSDHFIDQNELCSVCSYLGMSTAIRKEVLESTEDAFMVSTSHDWALMIRANDIGKIKYIGKTLQSYRQHSNNTSVIKNLTRREKRLKFIARQKYIIDNTMKFLKNSGDISTFAAYSSFLNDRYRWIHNKKACSIIINTKKYVDLKYSLRNIVADLSAIL